MPEIPQELTLFISIGMIAVLLAVLEVLMMAFGISAGDSDADMDSDFSSMPEIPEEFNLLTPEEMSTVEAPADDRRHFLRPEKTGLRKFLSLIGIGNGPLVIALATMSSMIAAYGFIIQGLLWTVMGVMLPQYIVLVAILVPALRSTGVVTEWLSRLVPSLESYAIPSQTYNGRRGKITYGTARRGQPVPVRWTDSYGNTHTTIAEPLRDVDAIPQDSLVLLVKTRENQPRIIAI